MVVVRYAALAALVVWLGALQASVAGNAPPHFATVEIACGGLLLVCLLAMKFLGPPPRAFAIRLPMAIAMLAIAVSDRVYGSHRVSTAISMALGFGLLFWYARE